MPLFSSAVVTLGYVLDVQTRAKPTSFLTKTRAVGKTSVKKGTDAPTSRTWCRFIVINHNDR